MSNFSLNKKKRGHLNFWIFFTSFCWFINPPYTSFVIKASGVILMTLSYAYVYYIELKFIFPKFYTKKLLLLFAIILTFISFHFLNFLICIKFLDEYSDIRLYSYLPLSELVESEFVSFCFISFIVLASHQNKIGINKLKLKSAKEKALITKELGVLKNKFNSHITFDFLNHCYDKIHEDSKETAEVIAIFSRMLDYSLNSKAFEKVLLDKEIGYLNDFIKLQKLLSTDVMVTLSIKGDANIYILPRILIAFVENAFKHGDLHSADHPINIELNTTGEYVHFTVTNKKNKHKIIEPSGIGNFNMKQQLELLYKNKYTLTISDEDTIYSTHLKLQLI